MSLEAFLDESAGSRRHTVDARRNWPRIGRIIMVYERHATNCTNATSFGPVARTGLAVFEDEVIDGA